MKKKRNLQKWKGKKKVMFYDRIPKELFTRGKQINFKKDKNIFKMNGRVSKCYFIEEGIAKIYFDHNNGRRSTLDFVGKGDWLGELSLFGNEEDVKENKVLREISCLEYDLKELKILCKTSAEISYYFATYISKKLVERTYRMSEGLNYYLNKRLAAFILAYEQDGIYEMPHTDVAEYLNVSYRHVLYVMKQFKESGLIQKENGKRAGYKILDKEKLEAYLNM